MPLKEPQQPANRAFFLYSAPVYPDYDPATAPEQAARAAAARQLYEAAPPAGTGARSGEAPTKPASPSATPAGRRAGPPAVATGPAPTAATANTTNASGPVPVVQPIVPPSFDFQDSLPRNVLTSYMARAMQMEGMCTDYLGYAASTGLRARHPTPGLALTQATLDTILAAEADFILDVGAKFIGRVAQWWGQWGSDRELERLVETAEYLHTRDPQLVLQACVFEYIDTGVQHQAGGVGVKIPRWAWEEFYPGQPYRSVFNVRDGELNPATYPIPSHDATKGMLFDDAYVNQNTNFDPSNPVLGELEWGHSMGRGLTTGYFLDITRTEAKMWVYWRAVRYLDAGCEAIHFGQVGITGSGDPSNAHWLDVLTRIRNYAAGRKGPYFDETLGPLDPATGQPVGRYLKQWPAPFKPGVPSTGWRGARRGVVFCDAHTYGLLSYRPGTDREYQLLFDFHSFPLRPSDRPDNNSPNLLPRPDVELRAGYGGLNGGAIYGRSTWGYAPIAPYEFHAGAPFFAEFDNFGRAVTPLGTPPPLPSSPANVRSYDEISWFGGGQPDDGSTFALQSPIQFTDPILSWVFRKSEVDEPEDPNDRLAFPRYHQYLPDAAHRDRYLRYFWHEVRRLDDNGWFPIPGRRGVALGKGLNPNNTLQGIGFLYRAYNRPPALAQTYLPSGYGEQQDTIRGLFRGQIAGWEYDPLQPDPNNPNQSISWANVAGDLFTDSTGKITYRGTDNRMWLFYRHFDASTSELYWSQASIDDQNGVPYSVGGSVAVDEGRRCIYFLSNDPDPDVCNLRYSGSGWHYQNMGSLPASGYPADYAPTGVLLPDSSGKVFYITRSGHVCTCYQDGPGWAHVVLNWSAPLAAGDLVLTPTGRLFYRGLDDVMHSLHYLP